MGATNQLVWQIGCKFGFVTATVKLKLIEITNSQWDMVVGTGGKAVVSGTVGGESVSFNVPPGFDVAGLSKLCLDTYREITDMTDAETEAYALREDISGVRPSFSSMET